MLLHNAAGAAAVQGDVLVVDDEPMVRDFVAKILTRNGFPCRTASDAGEAMATAMDRTPSVVVSDIRMPGRDGSWLLAEFRKRWPQMPVIMLTAVSEANQAVECLKAGAQDYLLKPINIDELVLSVRRGVDRGRPGLEAGQSNFSLPEDSQDRRTRLSDALATIQAAYRETLGPSEPVLGEDAIELASLRIARHLVAEGGSHLDVMEAIGQELLDLGTVRYARLWAKRGHEGGPEAVVDLGASGPKDASLARSAFASRSTEVQVKGGITSVAAPVVVRAVADHVLQLGWPSGPREVAGSLTERLASILADSLASERDARTRSRAAEELQIFQKLASASRHSLDLQHVAEFLMKSLHRIVDYDVAALVLLEDVPSLTLQARCAMDDEFSRRIHAHIGNTLKLTCGLELPPHLEVSFVDAEQERQRRGTPAKLRSFVNVPLSVAGSVVGLVHVSSGRDQAFGEEDVLFVHRAADFLASSVQGVRELLAAVKGRVEQMVDHMTDGLLMLDARGRVVAMNGAARSVLGCPSEVETPDAAALAKLLEWDPMSQMRADRRNVRKLVCLRGIPYQMQLSPVEGQEGDLVGAVLAFRDFEEEKRADEMKTELVNVVSHELRTPLTAIRNALFLLRGPRLGPLSSGQNRFVDLAKRNVEQLIDIVNDLLDLSKIEAGKMHLDLEPTSMSQPITDVLLALEPQAEEKGVSLQATLATDLPQVHGHAASIQRVVVNLVANAIKFTERGGRVSVAVALAEGDEVEGEGGAVRVTVSDSGVGIPQDQLESIFEKFHQVEAQDRKLAPGTGLGLSICRELVKVHHGRIWAESEPGRGSRFSFVVPVLSQRELIERAISAEIARARETGCPMALVVGRLLDRDALRSGRGEDGYERTMNELVAVSRRVVRRSSDLVLSRKERGEIVVILPRTMREGGQAFGNRLREELEKTWTDEPVALRAGAMQYPEDARSAADLYRLALENIGELVVA